MTVDVVSSDNEFKKKHLSLLLLIGDANPIPAGKGGGQVDPPPVVFFT